MSALGQVCLKISRFLFVALEVIGHLLLFMYGMQNKDRFSREIMSWEAFVVRNSHTILHSAHTNARLPGISV